MNKYLEEYFKLLINTSDFEVIEEFLPTITLDKTNELLDLLIEKLKEELVVAVELGDDEYKEHLDKLIELLQSKKQEELNFNSPLNISDDNILVYSPGFLKSVQKLDDVSFYRSIKKAIDELTSKEWMAGNANNKVVYRRLHGETLIGLSEAKANNIRLVHMHINGDFWYVIGVFKKEGTNKMGDFHMLEKMKVLGELEISVLLKRFTKNGELDYMAFAEYAANSSLEISKELNKWGGKGYE